MKRFKRYPKYYLNRLIFCSIIALCISGAFWIQDGFHQTRFPASEKGVELYANQTDDNLTHTFVDAINGAKKSILLVVYSLSDPQIIASLRQKSQQGVDVRVVYDSSTSFDVDRKLGSQVKTIRRFGPGLMHQKILVIDQQLTWLGSANMTTESLRMHGNLVVGIDDPHFASVMTAKANALTVEGVAGSIPMQTFQMGGQTVELWFLPDNANAIYRLKQLMRQAQKSIRIAMFTWTRRDLAMEAISAAKRGVQVEAVIDYYAGKGAGADIVELFVQNGVSVRLSPGGPLLHHKFMYIDERILVNGSANWTHRAFTMNDDCFLVISDLSPIQVKQMNKLWQKISSESIKP